MYVYVGDVGLSVTDPQGRDVPVTTDAMKNNSFKIGFQPTQPGIYEANVYFGDEQVPGSPFKVGCAGTHTERRLGGWLSACDPWPVQRQIYSYFLVFLSHE